MYALCVSGAVITQGFVWSFFMRYISISICSFKPIAAFDSTYKPIPACDNIYKPIFAFKNTYKPIRTFDNTYKPIPVVDNTYKLTQLSYAAVKNQKTRLSIKLSRKRLFPFASLARHRHRTAP